MTNAPRIPCGEQVSYYSSWETDTWLCRCGWTGTGKEASSEPFSALLQVDCPKCDGRLCLVIYPSPAEERAAAKTGKYAAGKPSTYIADCHCTPLNGLPTGLVLITPTTRLST